MKDTCLHDYPSNQYKTLKGLLARNLRKVQHNKVCKRHCCSLLACASATAPVPHGSPSVLHKLLNVAHTNIHMSLLVMAVTFSLAMKTKKEFRFHQHKSKEE